MEKRVTIADIAKYAGVSKTTVSFVLNGHKGRVPISKETCQKIHALVRKYNYQPSQMARSLTTKITKSIGFYLSDDMEGGFANVFFAEFLNGIEQECQKQGYSLNVGLFNLSNIDSFLFPSQISQHAVDGVILAGRVADEILDKFSENRIPCVCIGDYMSHPERMCTVSFDTIGGQLEISRALKKQGIRRVVHPHPVSPRDSVELDRLKAALSGDSGLSGMEFLYWEFPEKCSPDYSAGPVLADMYFKMPEEKRPEAFVLTDQTAISLMQELRKRGVECPRDISIVSTSDTALCRMTSPALAAIHHDIPGIGKYAAKMLIEHLKAGTLPTSENSRNNFRGELVLRDSVKIADTGINSQTVHSNTTPNRTIGKRGA